MYFRLMTSFCFYWIYPLTNLLCRAEICLDKSELLVKPVGFDTKMYINKNLKNLFISVKAYVKKLLVEMQKKDFWLGFDWGFGSFTIAPLRRKIQKDLDSGNFERANFKLSPKGTRFYNVAGHRCEISLNKDKRNLRGKFKEFTKDVVLCINKLLIII